MNTRRCGSLEDGCRLLRVTQCYRYQERPPLLDLIQGLPKPSPAALIHAYALRLFHPPTVVPNSCYTVQTAE